MQEILKKLGLEHKEIEVYLVLLKMGSTTASQVSKETNIDRATTYRYLDSLAHKGLLGYVIKNNVKYYNPAPPEKILEDLKEKTREYEEILPKLQALTKLPKEETIVELYKGKEGITTILKDILTEGKDYYVFGAEEKFEEILPVFSQQFLKRAEKQGMSENLIINKGTKLTKIRTGKYKTLTKNLLAPITTVVYGDKTALLIWSEPSYGILIKGKDVSKANKEYFKHLWEKAK